MNPVVPPDLAEYADSVGCNQVTDFYVGRYGVMDPPYVYIDMVAPLWTWAAALWCRPQETGGYTLLIRHGEGNPLFRTCPGAIANQGHIGGLSVEESSTRSLRDFTAVDDRQRAGPDVPMPAPAIRSEYDGVGAVYACFEGRWYVLQFD